METLDVVAVYSKVEIEYREESSTGIGATLTIKLLFRVSVNNKQLTMHAVPVIPLFIDHYLSPQDFFMGYSFLSLPVVR